MQKSIALSSGEAELVAQVSGIIDGLGIRNLLREFGADFKLRSFCDSSAARGILNRSGAGRIKHLELHHLWVQGFVQAGEVTINWIPRQQSPSDGLTHGSSAADFWRNMKGLQLQFPMFPSIPTTALIAWPRGGVGHLHTDPLAVHISAR